MNKQIDSIPAVYSKEWNRVRGHILLLKRCRGTLANYFELKLDDPVEKFLALFHQFQSCGRAVHKELDAVIAEYEAFHIALQRAKNEKAGLP